MAVIGVGNKSRNYGKGDVEAVSYLADFTWDIIQRKQAEEELQKLSQAVEQSPVSVVITDTQGTIQYVNPKFSELTGYTAAEAIGQNPRILKSGIQPQDFYQEMWTTLTAGNVWHGELCNLKKDGEQYWELASIAPVKDAQGKVTHYVAVKEDITERKRIVEELYEAKEAAEAATLAKSSFLANMSHEIRTPMNSILGFLELVLEESALPDLWRGHLNTAHVSASNLLGLINDILDVSKLESGKFTIEERPFSLRRLMEEIHKTMGIMAQKKGVELRLDLDPSVSGSFVGDPLRIRQIIINLAGNAVKFTEKGRVAIRVKPAEEDGRFHFLIEDTGIGIPPDRLPHIFDLFTQADKSTTRHFGGTGLGTTIARDLVELMGGRIWAESEEGKGSIFHFTIPLAPTEQAADETDLFVVPGKPVAPGLHRGLQILLAEDAEANIELARIRLTKQGHQVTVARNGQAALEVYQQRKFDVILMDVQMPEMSGIEATERIRALEATTGQHVPIIALTGGVTEEEMERDFKSGMDAVIAKPIDFGKLFRMIDKLVPSDAPGLEAIRSPAGSAALPSLDGVDIQKGIQIWQDPDLYARTLLEFSQEYSRAATDLIQLFDEEDMDGAGRLVHKLKGVTGNLALTEMAEILGSIDALLKKKDDHGARGRLHLFVAAMERAVASISQLWTMQKEENVPKKEMDLSYLTKLFVNMLAGLDQFSPDVVQPILIELKEYLPSARLRSIQDCLERYDFDAARQEVIALARSLEIDSEGVNDRR